ncbi:AAA family ATPase [Roseovarius sp. M141]|uniref:AAA family ATPase n=1 Tax=Roseovarius sp. M141 TaxID=2583806 RepID=UPI0020CE624E|nr:AAA family ATPase [Roseovarius sp. M141]MCQ0093963.1 AAA family ATPase [Roseovarius sp. M141]
MSDRGSEPLGSPAASPTVMQIPIDDQDALRAAGGDPLAVDNQGRDRPAVHVPTSALSLMLRLCATIGTQARVKDIMAPGAVTLIEIGPDTGGMSMTSVRSMLESTILPDEAQVWPAVLLKDADPKVDGVPDLCVVEIAIEDRDKLRIRGAALQGVTRALDAPYPVLILAETLAQLPEDLRRALPDPLQLAPLSRDILMAMIAATSSATGKIDPELFDALPQDRALARLSDASLTLALRAATPREVAARLLDTTRRTSDGGPTLDDIEGYGEAEAAARRMVADLQGWSDGRIGWADVQRSVLLWGPPGTGKSHLARAMAGSAGVALVRGSFASWQAMGNLSHMLRAMRASFDEAAAARPAILVIDEIDAVGDRADPDPHNNSYRAQVINAFLEALDSLKYIEGVMIVATTNFPDKIDAAVLRPGRIDIKAQVPLPGAGALAQMLRDGLGPDIPPEEMARLTRAATGQSAADVDGALRQARSAARQEGREVAARDVLTALDPEAEDHSPARERRIALHECGHAIVGTCLGLGKITRLVLTRQGGQAWLSHASGELMLEDLEAELTYALAGRAAERLILGVAAAGAGGNALSDLAQATQTAIGIDTRMGLGAEGPVWLDISSAAYLRDPANAARIRARLEAAEARAMRLLETRRGLLIEMAADLVKVGLLEGARLDAWLARAPGASAPDIGSHDNSRALAPSEETGSHDAQHGIKGAAVAQNSGAS